jgi:hypothetical protein
MTDRQPVTTLEELGTLDHAEVMEGYMDGLKGEPCGDNRSRSFWHGWRNGMVDGGHAAKQPDQAELAMKAAAAMCEAHGGTKH